MYVVLNKKISNQGGEMQEKIENQNLNFFNLTYNNKPDQ